MSVHEQPLVDMNPGDPRFDGDERARFFERMDSYELRLQLNGAFPTRGARTSCDVTGVKPATPNLSASNR
ncbi:hypothetical protein HMSSN139_10080 [Paenibacillus sp. HMSSN-139]|nr:hypothetical protein HMSSN139_10080 [Paenibacillus sp. HMSSN-139]